MASSLQSLPPAPAARAAGSAVPARSGDEPPVIIDVSRLIWRRWTGRLPTGIDRVCLAYLKRFGARASVLVQWRGRRKGRRLVFAGADARRLVAAILDGGPRFRRRVVAVLSRAIAQGRGAALMPGQLYLNIGHTGLDDPGLAAWIARHRLRAIYLVHDLIPIDSPEFCRAGEAERHARRMANALTSASGVIANSRATVDSLRAFAAAWHLPQPPMVAAWLAGDALPAPSPTAPHAGVAADRPYFVVVGTIEGRKNHILLLRLWKRLAERMGEDAPRLILIGQRGWEAEHALAMLDRCTVLRGTVVELGRCGDAELGRWLAGARALLMPSFTEGFGMPVVEALRLGTPVIASDLPVFREIAGDIPTYIPSFDGRGWEEAVLDFSGDSPERDRQLAAMRGYRSPDWPGHFARVERWLTTLPG